MKTIANVVDMVRGVRCSVRVGGDAEPRWWTIGRCITSATEKPYWFYPRASESCKGMETATTSSPARLLAMIRTQAMETYTDVSSKLQRMLV
jgi:hypothetical protein